MKQNWNYATQHLNGTTLTPRANQIALNELIS